MKKHMLLLAFIAMTALPLLSLADSKPDFKSWAPTPPMGWNSWDCYGPTVTETEVKANADYMAEHLAPYGWEYIVVDIRWFVDNDKAGGYNQKNPIYNIDEWGRYTPAVNRFPSAADGAGFKPLADYVHSKGLKFGIHIMRGCPKVAAKKKCQVKGAPGITVDMIASNDSACIWLRDNYKVVWDRPGAQEYYNSIFDLYASWGVDFIKVDDLSRPYHTAEVEMIRNAIDQCGRPMVLSISPGETPIEEMEHVKRHANMWRTTDDFWDNWSQLNYQFDICARWAPYIAPGTWPDADMLPLGKISIRGERGKERWTGFTPDEQQTLMSLWTLFKSPLMFGGDLPQNDSATNALLTNKEVLYMHHYSVGNMQVSNHDDKITWKAIDPATGCRYAGLFNVAGGGFVNENKAIYRSGTISYLTSGYSTPIEIDLPEGTRQLCLVVTDGGDNMSADHGDWINPTLTYADGSTINVETLTPVRADVGWGEFHVNSNLDGGILAVNGLEYDRGLAVHANSIVVYDIPEGAKKFTALAGIDDTGVSQGSLSSIEFFVFDQDPTKNIGLETSADLALDLTLLGFEPGAEASITDMWTGKNLGNYSDDHYTTHLNGHASGLYKVCPTKRTDAAKVTLTADSDDHSQPFYVTATVTGVPFYDDTFIQLLSNGEVIATMPVSGYGTARYRHPALEPGESAPKLTARFSGTTTISPTTSLPLIL